MKFVVDNMLGKLARWLRILGYDTVFDPSLPLRTLIAMSTQWNAIFLTRRKSFAAGISPNNMYAIKGERFNDQLREVIDHFRLDVRAKLFSRCTKCNVEVRAAEKSRVKGKVPEKSFEGFDEFFECPSCGALYWGGSHRVNTLKKLKQILNT